MAVMYRRGVLKALADSFGQTFSDVLADPPQLAGIHYGIEYPMQEGEYPYCLIDFEESSVEVSTVSLRREVSESALLNRWVFRGTATFDFFSLSALERDTMIDGFIQVVGMQGELTDALRDGTVNPYIAIELNTQQVTPRGVAKAPGTPWGTDEVVYYASFGLEAVGEFYTEVGVVGNMVEIVSVYPRLQDDPNLPDDSEGQWV